MVIAVYSGEKSVWSLGCRAEQRTGLATGGRRCSGGSIVALKQLSGSLLPPLHSLTQFSSYFSSSLFVDYHLLYCLTATTFFHCTESTLKVLASPRQNLHRLRVMGSGTDGWRALGAWVGAKKYTLF